jgi:hypothetical protein
LKDNGRLPAEIGCHIFLREFCVRETSFIVEFTFASLNARATLPCERLSFECFAALNSSARWRDAG